MLNPFFIIIFDIIFYIFNYNSRFLSLEGGVYKDESNSIPSQKEILKDYISSREEFTGVKIREQIVYGYYETNFNGP